ncbi:NfeD family protein [Salinisphaera aquimarina]|uniref:Nodulation protein NfeD n=1 Tax=Salinisphaera aquimarina TaxID=2094031 RepID=A0ABV7ES35_9GAMM
MAPGPAFAGRCDSLAIAVRRGLHIVLLCCTLLWPAVATQAQPADRADTAPAAREIAIVGAIGPATSRYVTDELEDAAAADAPLVILRLDTPGGLDGAMREIVQAILASPVPVAGFVGPSGARAASAGTYILYASHIAAMAPATNLGAATPINIGGGGTGSRDQPDPADSDDNADAGQQAPADSDTAARRKVVNDAVAYIRGLAEQRGRNADWAEQAVRQGVSLTARQAQKQHVVDDVVADESALLAAIDGRTVSTAGGDVRLNTAGLSIEQREPGWRTQLLSVITNPTVAYLLLMIGIYGLILEGLNPGSAVPGVIGAICLLAALYAFQILPINYAGLALIVLGVALMIAEMFAPSFGILGLGGIVGFVFGSIMLMDTDVPGFEIPLGLIGGIAVAGALLLMFMLYMFLRSRRERVWTGREGLLGQRCVALEDFDGEGRVLLQGESWLAFCDAPVVVKQKLVVTAVDGLKVQVRAAETTPSKPSRH